MKNKRKICLIVPDWLEKALETIKNELGKSKSDIIREALEIYLREHYPELIPKIPST